MQIWINVGILIILICLQIKLFLLETYLKNMDAYMMDLWKRFVDPKTGETKEKVFTIKDGVGVEIRSITENISEDK